jgi:hypothetical protein
MILVVGVGVGVAGFRSAHFISGEGLAGDDTIDWMYDVHHYVGFFLVLASLLILILRLRQPQPTIPRIARQHGAVACFAISVLAIGHSLIKLICDVLQNNSHGNMTPGSWILYFLTPELEDSYIIAILWITFALGRIGRSEASWIDRAGRIAGWSWITWSLVGSYLERIH